MSSLAAAKHEELLGKPISAAEFNALRAQGNRLTHSWSSESIIGQAAVLTTKQAAQYCYDCLATGYAMKSESSILAQKVEQQTDDMVASVIEESLASRPRNKPQLGTYLNKLKRLQIEWESMAQVRYTSQLVYHIS